MAVQRARSKKLLVVSLAVLLLSSGLAGMCLVLVARAPPEKGSRDKRSRDKPEDPKERHHGLVAKVKEVAGMDLVRIPTGEFYMGSENGDADAFDSAKPRHKVRISVPFWLGKYKVTV